MGNETPPRIRPWDVVEWNGHVWNVDDIQTYDHLRGGVPKTLTLRRTIVVDTERQYLNEAIFRRGVPAVEVKLIGGES